MHRRLYIISETQEDRLQRHDNKILTSDPIEFPKILTNVMVSNLCNFAITRRLIFNSNEIFYRIE